MLISNAFGSKYLKASDLRGRAVPVKMDRVKIGKLNDGQQKPILYFVGKDKGLVLNRVNSNKIAELYGDDTDDWVDQWIELYPTEVDFKGDQVEAIRVRKYKQEAPARPRVRTRSEPEVEEIEEEEYTEKNPPPRSTKEILDDEVPF